MFYFQHLQLFSLKCHFSLTQVRVTRRNRLFIAIDYHNINNNSVCVCVCVCVWRGDGDYCLLVVN